MALRKLRVQPDIVLRLKARRVPAIDRGIHHLIDDMIETMLDASGVGLAAPQVGVSLRVVVIQLPEDARATILINPEMVRRVGERELTEGCLSVPGFCGDIKRAESVTVKAQDRQGKPFRIKATGLLAEVLEHELDHLNGVLYVDHLESPEDLHKLEPEEQAPTEGGVATGRAAT